MVKIARECGRYKVLTKNTYGKTVMKESQIATMEEFLDNIKTLIGSLNYNVLTPMPKANESTKYLFCKGSGGNAKGFISSGGLTVLKGSTVSEKTVPSLETRGKTYFILRQKLEAEGIIKDRTFQQDYEFNAPSAASAVIMGHTSNGNVDWKDENGVKLKDL